MNWEKLSELPNPVGVASPFAGVSGDALIVAGGANFPDRMPWEGGKKLWHDDIHVLPAPGANWKSGFKLPRPNAYGISITSHRGMICIGGGNAEEHFKDVFVLKWEKDKIVTESMPSLPQATAFGSGVMLDDTVYVMGGIETPTATNTLKKFWALDLSKADSAWKELEPWPGPGRMLAVAAAQDGSVFITGGTDLKGDSDGKPQRVFLKDGYRFTPGKGWKPIADLPRVAVAAPSPAPVMGSGWLVLGGDDATQLNVSPTEHRGFPREVLRYDTKVNAWTRNDGELPFSLVTTPSVIWNDRLIIPGGEARPGRRSPTIWAATLDKQK